MSKHIKRDLKDVDVRTILERLASIPIRTWSYESDPATRHIGPSSEDFYEVFGFGGDERYIGTIDADGVALAAIQGLVKEHAELREEVRRLRERLANLQPNQERGE